MIVTVIVGQETAHLMHPVAALIAILIGTFSVLV